MRATRVVVEINPFLDIKCTGCDRAKEDQHCSIYDQPKVQWSRLQGCAARTHNKVVLVEDKKQKKPLNPLKASKRGVTQYNRK